MNSKIIEEKWQKYWEEHKSFEAVTGSDKEPYYILVEFPYPSGSGLHVGHVRSYTAQDAMARMMRMQGKNVLFPMGWDAFGAPAEQYAIKNHIHPKEAVKENIKTFKRQMQTLGFSFDWDREFSTTDPEYYKWTQWQFLQFYKHGMAYKDTVPVNWCPNCKTVLSNEDAAGGVCERCGTQVVQKEKSQWMLRMSDYSEDLLKGLDDTNFAEKVKLGQINWIGKSIGAEVTFKIDGHEEEFTVFTTRCDTLFGATYCVLAPEHKLVDVITTEDKKLEVEAYKEACLLKNEMERTELNKEKTGVFTGAYAINPVNGAKIPIYISDYVLASYGTGAIMAVPAHDTRDYEFATKFNIPIIQVLEEVTGTPHEVETKKNSIVAILYDEANDKYLTVNWHEMGGRLFIGGTIKEGETALDCAIREIKEETGYKDIELVHELPKINHHYYAYNKDKYFNIESTGFLFKLVSNAQDEQNLDDDEKFDLEWVDKNTIMAEVNDGLHKKTFEYALAPGAMEGDGIHINSGFLDGLNKEDAISKMLEFLEENNCGKKQVNYKMRDWIFSRQRFWGEPIPMIYCNTCGWQPMNEEDLPLLLPDVAEYEPTDNGESPLAKIDTWVNTTCPKCGGPAKRETDTMPNWAGSSWYFLRFMDPHNTHEFASMDAMKYWRRVDWYNGGMEHTARHLLYARFWVQFLYNIGLVPSKEMIWTRVSHGMVLGSDNQKMSKSKGNVINPDDIVNEYGADTLRVYEMFMGDYQSDCPWSTDSLKGCKRFLDKVIRLKEKVVDGDKYSDALEKIIHKSIKKVQNDLVTMSFNTAISTLMILANSYDEMTNITKEDYHLLLTLLNPIAPHITEELNEQFGYKPICESTWPVYDEAKTIDDEKEIGVQVNGKLRSSIKISINEDEESIKSKALSEENVKRHIDGKEVVKIIVIPGRIVNIVVK
ncbi:MAG TPA: class I tRNA ligase family protein [Candidatus Onthocola stercoravium]|nr:class I tRNA ligase family protein [Candidatus Onthocola stercoravium]